MLKIAFLVTFCGLLARMAQAQTTLPCSNYNAVVAADTLQDTVKQGVPSDYMAPVPSGPIINKATGDQYTNVKPASPPDMGCTVSTEDGGTMKVAINGQTKYSGAIVTGKKTTKDVSYDVNNVVEGRYALDKNPEGDITCKAESADQATATSTSKPAPLGLLGDVIQGLLEILNSLLSALSNVLGEALKSTVPAILKAIEDSLGGILKTVTDSKPVPGKGTCKHSVNDVKTDSNKYLKLQVQSDKYGPGGNPIDPPTGEYVPPELKPGADTACIFAVPQALINKALEGFAKTPIEVTGEAVVKLSADITKVCGNGITLSKLVFTPTGNLEVVITKDKVSGTLTGTLDVFDSANALPFLTATGSLTYIGEFTYENGCIVINLVYDGMAEVKFVKGQTSCDVSYLASQAFTAELKGKATIQECVEPSPFGYFPINGPTQITPGDGYVTCDHKK